MRRAVAVPLTLAVALAAPHVTAGSTDPGDGLRLAAGAGDFLVLTDAGLDRVVVYDVSGDRPRKRVAFGEPGPKPGQLRGPRGAAVSARGDIFVGDAGNGRVQSFDLSANLEGWPGRLLRAWALDAPPAALAIARAESRQKRVFVADAAGHRVRVFDLDGAPAAADLGGQGSAPGRLDTPTGLALDPAGERLYVSEAGNHRVSAFAAETGAFLFSFGAATLRRPTGIATDARGDVLVADAGTRRVHRFRPGPAGARQMAAWGRPGTGDGQWTAPRAVAVDARDRVYVADSGGRCQVFSADGAYLARFGDDRALGYPPDAPPGHGDPGSPAREACSNGGRYLVRVRAPQPFPTNELFGMTVEVDEGCSGPRRPAAAQLRVDGGMPSHRHGMNTEPVVTPLGAGRFDVKGLLLHMLGRWELYFDVTDAGVTERAQLDVVLE